MLALRYIAMNCKQLTAVGDGESGGVRVGPRLRPFVGELLRVLRVVVRPGDLLATDVLGNASEDVRLADGRVVGPPPE